MQVSPTARSVAALLLVVGAALYLLLIDLGVNAGRIHYGVNVDGFEVGGRTFTEAVELLRKHGRELQDTPMVYRVGDYGCPITPKELGWGPQPHDTAEAAMAVGRPLRSFDSIGERVDAWLGGVRVHWADSADPAKVTAAVERCHREADAGDVSVDNAQVDALLRGLLVAL